MEVKLDSLEKELNKLWIERCKANDKFLEFVDTYIIKKGYTIKFSDEPLKQLVIVKQSKDSK